MCMWHFAFGSPALGEASLVSQGIHLSVLDVWVWLTFNLELYQILLYTSALILGVEVLSSQ